MKTITLILSVLVYLTTFSQEHYKLYSKVWVKVNVNNEINIFPIDTSKSFTLSNTDSIDKKINMELVNSYLLKSFNEFRHDYGSSEVTEDVVLSQKSKEYSKKLETNFAHFKNDGSFEFECIVTLPIFVLSQIKPTDGNLNKLISECVFDMFILSNAHMSYLVNSKYKHFGFGLYKSGQNIYVVIRGKY